MADFEYYCLACAGTFWDSTLTACPYCGSQHTAPAETVNNPHCACACHTYQGTYPTSKVHPCWVCGHYEERS